jgi:hypothetical protein
MAIPKETTATEYGSPYRLQGYLRSSAWTGCKTIPLNNHILIYAILVALFLGYVILRVESAKWDKKIQEARKKIHGEKNE